MSKQRGTCKVCGQPIDRNDPGSKWLHTYSGPKTEGHKGDLKEGSR